MGVTEPWMVTTEGQKNWTAACEREIQARFNWNDKWGWMPGVMAETIDKLKELKENQIARIQEKEVSSKKGLVKNPKPLPNSVNHEYGWLATRPDYQLERFGPFPLTLKVKVEPTLTEIEEEVVDQDLNRAKRALEKKKMAKLERKMAEKATMARKYTEDDDPSIMSMVGPGILVHGGERPGSQQQDVSVPQADAGQEEPTADNPSKGIIDPGHVTSEGRKKRYCCCTANCPCLKINGVPQHKQ